MTWNLETSIAASASRQASLAGGVPTGDGASVWDDGATEWDVTAGGAIQTRWDQVVLTDNWTKQSGI